MDPWVDRHCEETGNANLCHMQPPESHKMGATCSQHGWRETQTSMG